MTVDDNSNVVVNKKQNITYGAYLHNDETNPYPSRWNYYDPAPNKSIVDIACVLGASYTTNKTYWQYLRGLNGLRSYGRDEELISLKVWLEGGSCKLIKDISMGHVYRPSMPYEFFPTDMVYNILYISELFMIKLANWKFQKN